MIRALCLLALLAGCAQALPEPEPEPPFMPEPIPVDTEELAAAFTEAFQDVLLPVADDVWAAHEAALDLREPGCPDLWLAAPDGPELAGGLAWVDRCGQQTSFRGALSWSSEARRDPADLATLTTAERSLVGLAEVADEGGTLFGFDGELDESASWSEGPDYHQWSWTRSLRGTARGSELERSLRADLSVRSAGGESTEFEGQGELHLLDGLVAGRFDSIGLDLWLGGGCEAEPVGWIGLRDPDATWFDLVFQAPETDSAPYANPPYGACEGCGTLYVRGVAQAEVCLDLAVLLEDPTPPPAAAGFVPSTRALLEAP